LPVDENFHNGISSAFEVRENNSPAVWKVMNQGIGADTTVKPFFGDSLLAFTGNKGAMSTFSTRKLNLSRTIDPSLSFWYFHDTIPCSDYTEVRITVDGGDSYTTLLSIAKYNSVRGWTQYSVDLPPFAVNQCVILVFEAMEKSNGYVTQYIDRILITARQDIAVSEVLTSELTACDLDAKDLKVVMKNLSDPALDYSTTPTEIVLEIAETGQRFTVNKTSGSLGSFASDTVTLATGFDFTKGTYTFKTYFSSVLDVDRANDTLETSIVINPAVSAGIRQESEQPNNCLPGETEIQPTITIRNTGNLPVSGLAMKLYIEGYADALTGTDVTDILPNDSLTYQFNPGYIVPWTSFYSVRAEVYLQCDSALVNTTENITECVNINDLLVDSILNPSGNENDEVGENITLSVSLENRGNQMYHNVSITAEIYNSQGIQQSSVSGSVDQIDVLSDTTFTFGSAYTVPDDTVYSIRVYVENKDMYKDNDTLYLTRRTDKVGITLFDGQGILLGQNIPNPANDRTEILYGIPSDGSVTFNVYSISGQVLYSQTVETTFGVHSIELNTSDLSAGIYFYSMEFKGQRLVKRMVVEN
jgi:hypothetical protein